MITSATIYDIYRTCLSAMCKASKPRQSADPFPHFESLREISFGKSHIGRDIPALQLGEGGGHRILYVGGVTGGMYSAALLIRFARDYAEAVQSGGQIAGIDISYLYHTRTITVVPLLNPDGAVLRVHGTDAHNPLLERLLAYTGTPNDGGRHTQPENPFSGWVTNGRGVDLRCNCDADFDLCIQNASGIGRAGYPGMHPESEPECAAVCRYLRACATTDLTLFLGDEDADSAFGCITYPGGEHRTMSIAQILARDIDAKSCITGISEAPGSFARWYKTLCAGPMLTVQGPGGVTLPLLEEEAERDGDAHLKLAQALLFSAAGIEDPNTILCMQDIAGAVPSFGAAADAAQEKIASEAPSSEKEKQPGMTLAKAEFALRYGKIRKALFHGTVL